MARCPIVTKFYWRACITVRLYNIVFLRPLCSFAHKCDVKFHFGCSTRRVRFSGRNERWACDGTATHLINHLILLLCRLTFHLFRFVSCITAPFSNRRREGKNPSGRSIFTCGAPAGRDATGEDVLSAVVASRWPPLSSCFCIRSLSCDCVLTSQACSQLITAIPRHCVSLSSPSPLWVSPSVPACFITGLLVGLICATVTVPGPQPPRTAFGRGQRGHTDRKEGRVSFLTVVPSVWRGNIASASVWPDAPRVVLSASTHSLNHSLSHPH